jgi:hypothetical protein
MTHAPARILLLVAAATAFTGCASFAALNSETYIEPSKAFKLGGGQPGAFTVAGRNAGDVPVSVFVEANGRRDSVTTIAPGAPVDAAFPAGAMAVFRNTSTERGARVKIRVTGDIASLGMRYEDNRR